MPGRHRQFQHTGLLLASALSVVVVATGSWAGYHAFAAAGCDGTVHLRVAAPPEITPALQTAATAWVGTDQARAGDACVTVAVNPVDATTMAAAIGGQHGVNLPGVGAGRQNTAGTDVWVADSSTWLLRLASEAPGFVPSTLGSIAESPIVLAVPEPAAGRFGWPKQAVALPNLIKSLATDKLLQPGIVDPNRDATGLAGLLAFAGAAGDGDSAAKLKVGVMRALSANSSAIRSDMLEKFPRAKADVGAGTSIGLAPLSEADVIAYNGAGPAVPLAALYPDGQTVALDYPYAMMPGVDPQRVTAATALRKALNAAAFTADLARLGLRAPNGSTGTGFAAPAGAPAAVPPPPAPKDPKVIAGAISQLLGSWTAITEPGRMLAVFDVSGSMNAKVPTAGGATRAEVTRGVARQGLALLDDRWSVGNWTFSTNMVGKQPWVENVPISSCATHRTEQEAAIDKIVPKDDGDTGLYDTALAAYRTVQDGWRAGVSNSVVIYTDGKNDNPGGLTINEVVDKMTEARDPGRPVRMIIIGIGTAVDRDELEAITKAAGSGGVYIATDPAKIGQIFLEAIASRKGA